MNTSKTYLMYKSSTSTSAYEKLCDITSYPDLLTAPGKLDATTLSHTQHVYEADIADQADLTFGVLYLKADMTKIQALQGQALPYAVYFGKDGEDGIFEWTGDIFVSPKGGGVGELRTGEITCYPSTEIAFS